MDKTLENLLHKLKNNRFFDVFSENYDSNYSTFNGKIAKKSLPQTLYIFTRLLDDKPEYATDDHNHYLRYAVCETYKRLDDLPLQEPVKELVFDTLWRTTQPYKTSAAKLAYLRKIMKSLCFLHSVNIGSIGPEKITLEMVEDFYTSFPATMEFLELKDPEKTQKIEYSDINTDAINILFDEELVEAVPDYLKKFLYP